MIVGFGVGLLTICVIGYTIHRYRERAKWAGIREEQLKRLKWLKRKIG